MGFEDLFKNRMRKHHGGHNPFGDYLRGHYDDRGGFAKYLHLLDRVKKQRKLLLAGCVVTAIIVLVLGAAAILAFVLLIDSISKSLSFVVCLSRIYLQVHYPSDVVAGFLAALFWVLGLAALMLNDGCDRDDSFCSRQVLGE